ncbi:HET-domain-containing protein [Dendrothele bispora CBS 962.96]|uniref:HET-domain-containing protein n=1 Tax=Dendrothele bispora (strain CBS 962.96) TaxID=1314807 RepID=A0A4S8LQ62_DENBC|nr:HET-domain-containing protein [Dendrothele bispora CBS 962.96]
MTRTAFSSSDNEDSFLDYALPRCPRHQADCLNDLIPLAPSFTTTQPSKMATKSYLARVVHNLFRPGSYLQDIEVCPRRLINTHSLKLVDFREREIPHYAIISHRWGNEEVGLQEFRRPTRQTKRKLGYRKIFNACEQARLDNLDYLWIDTCCINQEDQGDVHRNIKSMFAYYQNSRVCYAYLFDILGPGNDLGSSQWFDRAWTLQELLAPPDVFFFTCSWLYIGRRSQRSREIGNVTGIPHTVLRGDVRVQEIDVAERMSWSILRESTRPQDRAYCLLGILGVSIEPDYTENVLEAFNRLQDAFVKKYPDEVGELGGGTIKDLFNMLVNQSYHARGIKMKEADMK